MANVDAKEEDEEEEKTRKLCQWSANLLAQSNTIVTHTKFKTESDDDNG